MDARFIQVVLVLSLLPHSVATAAPSFQIVVANDFVGAVLSADGSVMSYASASGAASVGLFDVETGVHTPIASSTNALAPAAVSGDGAIAQGVVDGQLYSFGIGGLQLHGATDRSPSALSHDGSIGAGTAFGAAIPGGRASRTVGSAPGATTILNDLPGGGLVSAAYDLSGDGGVVVGWGSSTAGTEAFRWESGETSGLGDLPGGIFESRAFAVSNDGTTVVGYGTTSAGREAFRWRDGQMISLGNLPDGAVLSEARGVSSDGSTVVGIDRFGLDFTESRGFVWDETSGMRDLGAVLEASGLDLQHVVVLTALDVSSDGGTIVGTGFQLDHYTDPNDVSTLVPGAGHVVWVAVVPEPAIASMAAGGVVVLSVFGRRRRASGRR